MLSRCFSSCSLAARCLSLADLAPMAAISSLTRSSLVLDIEAEVNTLNITIMTAYL